MGSSPYLGTLIQDDNGNLYGTTFYGGNVNACNGTTQAAALCLR